MTIRRKSRGTRKKEIIAVVERLTRETHQRGVTVHDICYEMDMKPTTHLRNIVYELVAQGVLHSRWEHHRRNVQRAVFTLSRQWIDNREAIQARLENIHPIKATTPEL